jgi:hypothetical protein
LHRGLSRADGRAFFEMRAKSVMTPSDYMLLQRVYASWQLFGVVIAPAVTLAIAHTSCVRSDRSALAFFAIAATSLAGALTHLLLLTLPINVTSRYWTVMPDQFEAARRLWELSHAVAAALTLIALVAALAVALRSGEKTAVAVS